MEKIVVLGTGSASPTEIYNTCFILVNENNYILVDAGGGVGIHKQLKLSNINENDIHNIIVSHKHADHLFGVIWLIRKVDLSMSSNKYEGNLNIYCNDETAEAITIVAKAILRKAQLKEFGNKIKINIVNDKENIEIFDYNITFYNINGQSDKQFGFYTKLKNGKNLAFCGDEPLRTENIDVDFSGYDYLLHEAFCADSEANIFKPYEKDHATAKSAGITAEKLNVKNLILWHTEDKDMANRKSKYTKEAKECFNGNVIVPNDLEIIEL